MSTTDITRAFEVINNTIDAQLNSTRIVDALELEGNHKLYSEDAGQRAEGAIILSFADMTRTIRDTCGSRDQYQDICPTCIAIIVMAAKVITDHPEDHYLDLLKFIREDWVKTISLLSKETTPTQITGISKKMAERIAEKFEEKNEEKRTQVIRYTELVSFLDRTLNAVEV